MKLKGLLLVLSFITLAGFTKQNAGEDYTDFVKKYNSAWGTRCLDCKMDKDTYKVFLRNESTTALDIMVCLQESDKSWRRSMFYGIAPKDTLVAYACQGTGKILKWARKAGDKSISFPTIEEVNRDNK